MKSLEFNETGQETYFFGEYLTLNKITCSVEDYIVTTAKDILIKKNIFLEVIYFNSLDLWAVLLNENTNHKSRFICSMDRQSPFHYII